MRITFLGPIASMSGGDRVIGIYAEALRRRGHDVTVVVSRPKPPTLRERLRRLRRGQRPWVTEGPSHYDEMGSMLRRLPTARPIRADDCPDADVVIATWWETAEWMLAMPPSKGRQHHFVQHYEAFPYVPKDRVDAVLRAPTRKITISGWLVELLRDTFGNEDVTLIFNGVDTGQFDAPPRGKAAAPTVGMLYSSVPWKNCAASIAAFEALRREMPDARLITFGAEKESPAVPLPAGTEHHCLPAQDAIKDIYAACDVWLCSSAAEGFHLPPLEAMACRCPVVSTPVGGPADIVRDGVNGYLVPFDNPAAAKDALVKVLGRSDADWRALSDGAYRTARSMTWEEASDAFAAALRAD